jgi:hypothetical protein
MALQRWLRIVGSSLLGAAVLKLAAPAEACSIPVCTTPVRLPPGARMAGDHFYFKVVDADPGVLSLRTAEGEPIAASIRTIGSDRVFAPEQPLAAGTSVVIEYENECALEVPQSYEVLVDPPGSIELSPAELVLLEQGTSYPGVPSYEASFVRIRHVSGDTNGVATPLMTHTFSVDGQTAALTQLGSEQVVEVSALCDPISTETVANSCGIVSRVAPGVHLVEARTTIVGEVTQPDPVRLKVELRCPDDSAKSAVDDPAPDGPDLAQDELDHRTASVDSVGTEDALSDGRGTPPDVAPAASGGGGCSLALRPPRAPSSTLPAGLGALLVVSALTRRRRPRG